MANSSLSNVLYRTGWLELTGEVRNRLPLTGCSLLKTSLTATSDALVIMASVASGWG